MVLSFDNGVRPSMHKISQNKVMGNDAVGPGGSLNSLDL